MQCLILAGGLGSRMRPHTESRPKSLLLVENRPFIDYQLTQLSQSGVSRVVLCIGHQGEQIRDYVGDGECWGLDVTYVDEGRQLRGTAGALALALEEGELDDAFLVTYGDAFLPIDFREVWSAYLRSGQQALMVVYQNQNRWDRSNCLYHVGRVLLYDKKNHAPEMRFIDYGVSVLSRDLVAREVPKNRPSDLADLFHQLSLRGELAGYCAKNRFYEIGSPTGVEDFARYLRRHSTSEEIISLSANN